MGDEVSIVTYNQKSKPSSYVFSSKIKFIDLGVDYLIGKSYFHPDNLKKIPGHKASLQTVIRELKPDVIISCSFGPDFYFLPFVGQDIPKIKEFHSSRFFNDVNKKGTKGKLLQKLGHWLESKYESIVVLNKSEVEFYAGEKVSVIPNPAEILGNRADLTKKQILAAGRLAPVKNFADLIEAFYMINEDFPDWQLHFFGEDYNGTQNNLQEKITSYGLNSRIKFMGVTDDLKNKMLDYSIYAMTSETECFPMVLLESLSVGLPVVSYDSPTGPQHIVTDQEDGFITPYKNLTIFANHLKILMNDENLRKKMGESGLENVQRFSIDKVMHQWKDLFNSLLSEKK